MVNGYIGYNDALNGPILIARTSNGSTNFDNELIVSETAGLFYYINNTSKWQINPADIELLKSDRDYLTANRAFMNRIQINDGSKELEIVSVLNGNTSTYSQILANKDAFVFNRTVNGVLDQHKQMPWDLATTALRFIHEPDIYQGSYVVYNNTEHQSFIAICIIIWYNPSIYLVHFHGTDAPTQAGAMYPNWNIDKIVGSSDPTIQGYISVEPVYNASKYGPSHKAAKITINNYPGSAAIRIIPLDDTEDNDEFKVEAFS